MDLQIMNVIDLFSGCGGLSLGFQQSGFNILAAVDNWKAAVDCYKDNFAHPIYNLNLTDIENSTEQIQKLNTRIDMIIGGPPCQDFSHAGARIEGDRASLTTSFAKIISNLKPKWFVMENVDRALKSKSYQDAKTIFSKSGYGLTEIILDASKCNVPQKRKRLFVIGLFAAPENFMLDLLMKNQAEKPMTIRDYLGDDLEIEHYYRHPRNYNRRGIFSIDEPSPTIRGVNRPVPAGYQGHPKDPIKLNDSIRPLTTQERTLLQTFPNNFLFKGSKTTIEQLIGNAVPVNLARFVADAIRQYININEIKNHQILEENVS